MTNQNHVLSTSLVSTFISSNSSPITIKKPLSATTLRRLITTAIARKKDSVNGCDWIVDTLMTTTLFTRSPTRDLDLGASNWIVRRPSALGVFDEIMRAANGKQIVVFLDYDGTLSPIVRDPDQAFMSDAMRATVKEVAVNFPTAIVSGRCYDKVYSFVRLGELYYAGSHGMDIKGPSKGPNKCQKVHLQPALEFLPMINEVYRTLLEKTKSIPGATVEHNKFCVSVHFRCVDEKRWSTVAEQVRSVIKEYPKLRMTQGKKVLEIRPSINWDKGKAVEFLLESLGFANRKDVMPIYIGDDQTDEDAFKVLGDKGNGLGILVSHIPKATHAFYSLEEPSEVMNFLRRLVEWKRLNQREQL
ncbi:hypothetical protein Syun_013634 [Stephania yunnanensis]|uniref:Trehalose 6-phosphate phosphatase n=1 Tax=Stephania yunnanensis TaxID=152371 RepID=A0AAP0P8V2_9MAGN